MPNLKLLDDDESADTSNILKEAVTMDPSRAVESEKYAAQVQETMINFFYISI